MRALSTFNAMAGPYTQSATPGSAFQPEQHAITFDAAGLGRQLLSGLMAYLRKKTLQWTFEGKYLPIADLLVCEAVNQQSVRGCDQDQHMLEVACCGVDTSVHSYYHREC